MSAFFITGTGTDVGKTFLTCALTWQLRAKGHSAHAIKPVASGFDISEIDGSDVGSLLSAQQYPHGIKEVDSVCPWRFAAPLSPHMAAEHEGKVIDLDVLVSWCRNKMKEAADEVLLIEGAGGIMTPINRTATMLDLIKQLGIPAILVCGSYLGSISHTLSAVRAMRAEGVKCHALVLSESQGSTISLMEIMDTLKEFIGSDVKTCVIPRIGSVDAAWKKLPDDITYLIGA